ncbi:MAG: hypothetical protein ACFE0S_04850 [Rhodospirillales bacterium]
MSIFLAIVAFFMAFGALWFTSEIARRLDLRNRAAFQPQLAPLHDSLRRAERQIRDLALGLEAAERQIQAMNMHNRASRTGFSASHHGNTPVESNVTSLDILRGAQRFYPSETFKN